MAGAAPHINCLENRYGASTSRTIRCLQGNLHIGRPPLPRLTTSQVHHRYYHSFRSGFGQGDFFPTGSRVWIFWFVKWSERSAYINAGSMGIFCLPTSAVIPLHDHPGMTVLSKLLYGSVHVKSYDWVDPVVERHQTGTPHLRLAKLVADQVLSAPCESSALYPRSGGNIHCLTGVTPCAVLDVLAPPYSTEDDRNCTYYRDFPYSSHSENMNTDGIEEGLAWLQEYQPPDDFVVKPVPYKAPNIIL